MARVKGFYIRSIRKIVKNDSFVISVRPSARMERLGCHWTDFCEILHLSICRNSVKEIHVSLKSDKNIGHLIWRPACCTRWFKYDRDWFVCKQAALRSSCATLREWSHNLHPPSCSGQNLFSPVWELLEWWAIMVTKKKVSPGHIWTTLYVYGHIALNSS